MKKLILLALCTVSISAYALPTYEPFTEYSSLIAANPTNAIDLATGGYSVTNGPVVEQWSSLNFSGTATARGTPGGFDVVVTNNVATAFTSSALATLLPSGFPGAGSAIQISAYIPTNPSTTTLVGNPAVLAFSQDITRPTIGVKTIYVSYLLDITATGQTGGGNNGRYCAFLSATNLVEPPASGTGPYQTWASLFNTYSATGTGPTYVSYGVKASFPGGGDYILASDSAGGNVPATELSTVGTAYNQAAFVVGSFVFTTGGSTKDTNIVWVNPPTSAFGGPTPAATQVYIYTMTNIAMTDVGGFVLLARPGESQLGGIGPTFIGNLLIGTTWSYVTGGPEFTNQPVTVVTNYGSTVTLSGAAVAAGQNVTYQWQQVTATTTNNVINGSGGAGGAATVAGATSPTLTLTGISAADTGSYQLVATASGTGFSLASSTASVTADPLISVQPKSISVFPSDTATFTISATTQFGALTYQWQLNGAPLSDGARADGSTIAGATSSTLTISNFQTDESGDIITCAVTNGAPDGEISAGAVLTALSDPAIISQPQSATVNYGAVATFTASAQTTLPNAPFSYAWYKGSTLLFNGIQADGSTASGAQGTSSGTLLTSVLTLSNVSYLDDGIYILTVTNKANETVSSTAVALTVADPYIVAQPPANIQVPVGGTATISVAAAGSGLSYQWFNSAVGQLSNSGDDSGVTTPTLTISGAQSTDSGTYYVVVTGDNGSVQSSNVNVVVATAITAVTVSPPALTQQAGTHLALVGTITGGSGGVVQYFWQLRGTNLSNGTQADGSTISGVGTPALVVSNLHAADAGAYLLVASNALGAVTNTSFVTVSTGLLPLSPTNLVVTRIGEGSQPLSGATGNTLYLDQFKTNGSYVSTIMVPDSGSSAIIVPGPGTGSDGQNEAFLTLSSNQAYLNFAGYRWSYPYTGGSDVTVGGAGDIRGIGAIDGLGFYTLAYTNYGLYSGGDHYIRAAYSTDGLTNFWTTGAAGSEAIKYVQAGPGGASYATGNEIPGLSSSVTGSRVLGLYGRNLVFSDNGESGLEGLDVFVGAPELNATTVNLLAFGSPADFAFSPDTNTVYVADDGAAIAGGLSYGGGVQRWDWDGSGFAYSYTLEDTTGSDTNGARGLTVYFPSNTTTWGPGVNGAVIYATTSETVSNRLIQFVDTGVISTPTLLATAGPNQFLQGVRFGPATLPVSIVVAPQPFNAYVGQSNELTVNASGDGPLFYQWQFDGTNILGATTSTLVLSDLQTSNSGTYSVTISNAISTNSSSAVLSVVAAPPVLLAGPQSLVETVGDHLAFTVSAAGTEPIHYQWESNGVPIAGATNTSYSLTNVTVADSATYSVALTNIFGTNTGSAILQVTTSLQPLSSNNLVVARVGDGVQALSSTTANTVYLDQFTPDGVYSNTIMIPDNVASNALVVPGGPIEGPYGSVLTLSADGNVLNFVGFYTTFPATASLSGSGIYRDIGAVNAFGYYTLPQINQTIYIALDVFDAAVSLDGFTEFWTTGSASAPPGVKYADAATAGAGGGNVALGGSASGTRVIGIIAGNVVYSDAGSSPPGIWAFSGEPITGETPSVLISEPAGASPNDFAASPDTTAFPPSTSTVYVADNNGIASGGGIQRYDWNGSAYVLSYTLGTGAGSGVGASGLTVDFSANSTWGPGVPGAIIYATTAGTSGNSLIKIVDAGAGSSATVLSTANANEILRGVRFGPVQAPPEIVVNPNPQSAFVGGGAVFTVAAQNGPLSYQWQLNGTNLSDGPSISGSGAAISGSLTATLTVTNVGAADDGGNYTVIVSNPYPHGGTASSPALLSVPVNITGNPVAVETVPAGGTARFTVVATGGSPLTYQWTGPSGTLSDGPSPSGATIAGSGTASLTISHVGAADAGDYYVTVSNPDPSSASSSVSDLTVIAVPQFAPGTPLTGLGTGSARLNFSGPAGASYRVWSTIDLSLAPVTSTWTLLGSGTFSGGADSFAITPKDTNQFYVITQP